MLWDQLQKILAFKDSLEEATEDYDDFGPKFTTEDLNQSTLSQEVEKMHKKSTFECYKCMVRISQHSGTQRYRL